MPPWLTIKQAADHLAVSERTIRRYISLNRLSAKRVGVRLIRVSRESLLAFGKPIAW